MADIFAGWQVGLTDPATNFAAVTPNDSTDLTVYPRGISFVATGAIKVTQLDGTVATIPSGMAPGVIHWIRVKRIWSTDTTATGIVAWW